MNFKLNIGTLTNKTGNLDYLSNVLAEQRENIRNALNELYGLGWSGESQEKFEESFNQRQERYAELEDDIKYIKNALEYEEKPRAIKLKKRSEDFVNCIKGTGTGGAFTSDDAGIITLQGNEYTVHNIVDNCTSYYPRMNSQFDDIMDIARSFEYSSIGISDDVNKAETSIKNQTNRLVEFDDSYRLYCYEVRKMEGNICSVLSKISGVSNISAFKSSSVISPSGEIDKNKVEKIMLKEQDGLSDEDKEILAYLEKVIGEDKYNEIAIKTKEKVIKIKEKDDIISKLKYLINLGTKLDNPADLISIYHGIDQLHKDLGVYDSIKNAMDKDSYNKLVEDINIPKNFIENPVESFKKLNASISDTAFKKFIDNNKFLHDCVKYTTIRTEALLSDGVNIAKSPFEIANLNENADSKLADVIGVNIDRAFGTNGMDDEEAYNKALNNKVQDLSDAQNKTWNTIKNIPRGIWEDIKTTADINKIKDFILNPDMSLDDAAKWSQSAINTVGLIGGARAFVKGRFPVTEKVEVINECSIPPEIEDINKLSVDKIEEVNTGGETSYVKSSEISEEVSNSNVVSKTNKKGNIVTEYTNNSDNTLRMTEQRPKDIESSIDAKLKSNDPGDQVEGKVGKFINENTSCEITAFAQPVEKLRPKGPPAGDIDVATDKYIIEVKKSTKAIKEKQIDKYINSSNPDYFNYEGKQVIFYIDEEIDMSKKYTAEMIKDMESSGIKVVNSLEELKGVVE